MSHQAVPTLLELGSRDLALAGVALTLAGLAMTPICTVLARRFAPKAQVFFARWRFLHAVLVALLLVASSGVAVGVIEALPGGGELPQALGVLFANTLTFGATCALILFFAARLDPDGIRCLGLRWHGSLRAALVAVACFVLLLPGLMGLEMLWPWLLELLGRDFLEQPIAGAIRELSGPQLALAGVLVIAVQPFFEELIFRGFLQPLLVQNLGDRGGVFLSSLTFAVLHGDSAFLPIFGLALLLGSLQLRTQRLAAPWAVHALFNALTFLELGQADAP